MPSIVQFFHPGPEHGCDFTNRDNLQIKAWNECGEKHRRKFMLHDGDYIENGTKYSGKLLFWGEWEPPSIVEKLLQNNCGNEFPKNLHYPFLPNMKKIKEHQKLGDQNTDPFIFGNSFMYSNCRQKEGAKLQKLEEGSLILFGSRVNMRFAIDTVFVVKKSEGYTIPVQNEYDHLGIYNEIVLKMLHIGKKKNSPSRLVLYTGAPYCNPVQNMYSFVPAMKYNGGKRAFPRMVMPNDFYTRKEFQNYFSAHKNENGNISEKKAMGFKIKDDLSLKDIKVFWNYLKNAVSKNYVLGVNFKMPEYKNIA